MAGEGLARITRIASELPEQLRYAEGRAVRATALVVTRGIRAEIRSATGGDNRLSGVGRKGARVGARYKIYTRGTTPYAIIKATGPMHLIERRTVPHFIGPRAVEGRGSKKRFTGRKALKFDGKFAAKVSHPGTPAKAPFEKGYLKTRNEAGPIFDKEVAKAIRRVI